MNVSLGLSKYYKFYVKEEYCWINICPPVFCTLMQCGEMFTVLLSQLQFGIFMFTGLLQVFQCDSSPSSLQALSTTENVCVFCLTASEISTSLTSLAVTFRLTVC